MMRGERIYGTLTLPFLQSSVDFAFPECRLFILNTSYQGVWSVNAVSQNDATEISQKRLLELCLHVWGKILMGDIRHFALQEYFFSPNILLSALEMFSGFPHLCFTVSCMM